MSREEFIKGYCDRSGKTWNELSKWLDAIPCDCGDESCHGWQMKSHSSIAFDAELEAKYPTLAHPSATARNERD